MNASESEAKVVEDIPAASADEDQETREEERVATPPATDEVILEENVTMPTLLLLKQRRFKTLRLPPTTLLSPMTLSWLMIMWCLKLKYNMKPL